MSRIVFFLKNNTDLNFFKYKEMQNILCLPCLLMLRRGEGISNLYFSLCLTRSHNSVHSLSWHENKQVTSLKIHQLPGIIPTINQAGVETIGALRWSEHPLGCGAGADHRQVAQFSVLFIICNLFCTQ